MSELTLIRSKKRIRELEEETTHYLNAITDYDDPSIVHNFHNWSDDSFDERSDQTGMFYRGLYEKVKYISGKLGFKQAYYINYSGLRNAVWGFEIEGIEYLLYYSNEGLTLQCDKSATSTDVLDALRDITKKWRA